MVPIVIILAVVTIAVFAVCEWLDARDNRNAHNYAARNIARAKHIREMDEAYNRAIDPARTAGGRAGKYQATDMYYLTEQDLDEVERRQND
jgi:lipopolysaccharide export LptBFGC system permease protein LptF